MVPTVFDWPREIKYDGYRRRIVRKGNDVRLMLESLLDGTWRFPCIVETALKVKHQQCFINGAMCVRDVHGISDFDLMTISTKTKRSSTPSTSCQSAVRICSPLLDGKGELEKRLRGRAHLWYPVR